MSIEVGLDALAAEVERRDFGYLLTVSDDHRPHLLALRPEVDPRADAPVLRFNAGGGRACRNAQSRPDISVVFPPVDGSDGMSLVVDGRAVVDGAAVSLTPTWAVLHRAAP